MRDKLATVAIEFTEAMVKMRDAGAEYGKLRRSLENGEIPVHELFTHRQKMKELAARSAAANGRAESLLRSYKNLKGMRNGEE